MAIRLDKSIRQTFAACAATGALLAATPAAAREIERQQIGQYASNDQAPRTRTECIDRERGLTVAGDQWIACTEWRTQAQIQYSRIYLVLDAAENVTRADRRLASSCMHRAAAEAQSESAGNPSATSVPFAQAAFERCAERAALDDIARFTLSIEEIADWSGWR